MREGLFDFWGTLARDAWASVGPRTLREVGAGAHSELARQVRIQWDPRDRAQVPLVLGAVDGRAARHRDVGTWKKPYLHHPTEHVGVACGMPAHGAHGAAHDTGVPCAAHADRTAPCAAASRMCAACICERRGQAF